MRKTYNYVFSEEDAKRFASEHGNGIHINGRELIFQYCPYCGKEGVKKSDTEKFSINLDTGQFHCFRASCGARGNMLTLARDFNFSLGREWDDYYKLPTRRTYKRLEQPKERIVPKDFAIEYFRSRGISEDIVRKHQITVRADKPTVIAMPFFDENGVIQFVKYRRTDKAEIENCGKEYTEKDCKAILYGMECCTTESRTLIITEGQIDSLSLDEAGIKNAVSVPTGANGFTWLPHCWNWIRQNFDEIIVFGDHEKGHISLLDEINRRLGNSIRIKHVKESEYKDCKDANDILRKYGPEQLRKCVNNAVYVQNDALINIVDVERIDLDKIEKFKTGIVEIDSLIGGIPLEGTTVITGKSGEGKSTFASQVLAKAIDAGYKCMAYSGELPNGMFKEWLYLQLAGKNNIYMLENSPHISVDVESKIDAWIDEKLWLYDVDSLFKCSENELSGLLEIIEQAILQYECRVILIDNLMTALDIVDPENVLYNKYEAQAHFVRKLAEIGRNYKVAIILVAHKRKNGNSSDTNDEISGSSEITNYSTMIINYSKYTASEIANGSKPTDRKMSVTKERLKGGSANSFNVTFEPNSKRIYNTASNMLGYKFGWEDGGTQATGWSEVGNIELPFS